MQPQQLLVILGILLTSSQVWCQSIGKVTFQDNNSEDQTEKQETPQEAPSQQRGFNPIQHVENLFDYIGLGTGRNVDPYLAKVNERCISGDLAECFKSQALSYFSDFFDHVEYSLNDYVRIKRMSDRVVNKVDHQPYEYSNEPRSEETEWDQLLNFIKRKIERFVKTMSFELTIPDTETGSDGSYKARFLDEIADEVNILEDKKDTLFSRYQLRRLIIPMLLILKLFKLKLLLFLPLILGLASFKKFLGFLAIVIPGIIGFFKFYKPYQTYHAPVYTKNGIGYPQYGIHPDIDYAGHYGSAGTYGQDLAYRGYQHYNSK
ncbi:uncharacterized protein LOC109856205 [Pseudomyrmex gracilis]|uniref:uncharacterized protein LOC109856205 n=1 Tax=Pseudomyrmex gracilis TaxID=219809 RepID=UPI000995091F|nr:uncharacterized protein LOC109856205 [Pseudomyrmex gracilis]XP_020286812.1 uncharacterized protein LOC109856205 [Pseudomyrmex gracilis]XP_020286813.1 uncharacterized protein LOC109856205 [Pseudomyrmex gracilis]